jgi:hypothetical protein
MTTDRSIALTNVYPKLIAELSPQYKNFKMIFKEYPLIEIDKKWILDGKDPLALAEPVS